jgi:hypothetical protein
LYQDGWNDLSLQRNTRWIGVLAAASILFNVTARWWYIPATFLLGWLALTWLTGNTRWEKGGEQTLDEVFAAVSKKRSEMLKNISLLSTAERTLGLMQKKKRQEIAAGSGDFKSAREAIQAHLDAIADLRTTQVEGIDVDLKNAPLAFGRYEKAWKNGLYGAGWGSLFALPWLAAYLISFMQGTNFARAYGLSFLAEILSIVTFWAGIGFFMGYFFPYLRGESGLQKGLNLAMVIMLPTLPLHIIHFQTFESWQGFFLWAAQVFVECVLLGLLAFDYASVRESGHSWESLLEIHGLLSIGIWVSGVLATLAAGTATLISSPETFLDWLNKGLQIILPVFSQLDRLFY